MLSLSPGAILELPVKLNMHVFLDWGRKPEDPEKTQEEQERHVIQLLQ